ncbi:hypothetical protein [Salinibacterium sp. GXW1014]|uniref:hypothetical protein n=1 Tax=Salinibacterium sp. GXW1014 TaxID=3377838 RepID=UPI00383BA005
MTQTTLPIRNVPTPRNPYVSWLFGLGVACLAIGGLIGLLGIGEASVLGFYPASSLAWAVAFAAVGAASSLLWLTVQALRWRAPILEAER